MKAILLTATLFLSFIAFGFDDDPKPYITKTFNANSIKALQVRTSGGSINTTGRDGEAKVEVIIRPNNWNGKKELSKDEIDERLQDYELTIKQEGDMLICKAKRKKEDWSDWKNSLSISFRITVPEKTTTDLATSGGSIRLANLTGNQSFTTSGGSLYLTDLKGNIKGRTSGGSIHVANCQERVDLSTSGGSIKAEDSNGDLRLITSGGSISLDNISGDIEASTSGGSIRGNNLKGSLEASTSGGSIRISKMGGSLKASTSAGSVEVEMVSLGKFLDLATSAGGIRVQMPANNGMDLDLRGNKVDVALKNFDGTIEKDRVKGALNGGGTAVSMRASAGSIQLQFQ